MKNKHLIKEAARSKMLAGVITRERYKNIIKENLSDKKTPDSISTDIVFEGKKVGVITSNFGVKFNYNGETHKSSFNNINECKKFINESILKEASFDVETGEDEYEFMNSPEATGSNDYNSDKESIENIDHFKELGSWEYSDDGEIAIKKDRYTILKDPEAWSWMDYGDDKLSAQDFRDKHYDGFRDNSHGVGGNAGGSVERKTLEKVEDAGDKWILTIITQSTLDV